MNEANIIGGPHGRNGLLTYFFRYEDRIGTIFLPLGDLKPDLVLEAASDCREETLRDLRFAGYRFYPINNRGFQESARMTPVVRGRHVFLNYLVSVRPPDEIRDLFAAIQPEVDRLDLDQTSKLADPENLRRIQERAGLAEGGLRPGIKP